MVRAFWSATMSVETRSEFRWKHLFAAPMIVLSFADPQAYLDRYAEPDKSRAASVAPPNESRAASRPGLGESLDAWPTPYWTVDASFATMTLLLAAHDAGLGADDGAAQEVAVVGDEGRSGGAFDRAPARGEGVGGRDKKRDSRHDEGAAPLDET